MDDSFFQSRHLPVPDVIHEPESVDALKALVQETTAPLVFLGNGLHVRAGALGEQKYHAVRTTSLDAMIRLDKTSMIAQVESGMTWGGLRAALSPHGASLALYGLNPEKATIGGLLARRAVRSRVLFDGDIRDGLISVDALTSEDRTYQCLPAPRKSSGPDLRYMFVGSQGAYGPILCAHLMVWPNLPGRLFSIESSSLTDALELWQHLLQMGMRFSWTWWDQQHERFLLAARWPDALGHMFTREMSSRFYPLVDIQEHDALIEIQEALEAHHPGATTSVNASKTLEISMSMSALADHVDDLTETFEQLMITHWTWHGALIYGVMSEDVDVIPAWLKRAALDVQPVRSSSTETWSTWDQDLKHYFDANHTFAVGP